MKYAQQMFERFNFPESDSIPEAEPPTTISESDTSSVSQTSHLNSYVAMVTEKPSPPPAWAIEWNVADHVGFTPPSDLQMAQQRLAFSLLLAPQSDGGADFKPTSLLGLIPDLVEAVCSAAQRLQFPRVGAEVKFQAFNALAIDARLNRQYDRIYVGAQASASDLTHFQALLAPGGCLIGPFDGDFLRVQRAPEGQSDNFETTSLMRVAYAPLVRPDPGEDPTVLALPPRPLPPPPLDTGSSRVTMPAPSASVSWSSTTTVAVGSTGACVTFVTRTHVHVPKPGNTTVIREGLY